LRVSPDAVTTTVAVSGAYSMFQDMTNGH
jgi:hypothetical protein